MELGLGYSNSVEDYSSGVRWTRGDVSYKMIIKCEMMPDNIVILWFGAGIFLELATNAPINFTLKNKC